MKPTLLALLYSVLISFGAAAQQYTFKVLVNKGGNEVKSGSAWQPVKVGSNLNSTDEVRIAENSYLGLMHATGKPLEIKKPGSYKIADLAGRVKGGSTVLNKYTDFILSDAESKQGMTATGAVHRGFKKVDVFLPEGAPVYGDVITIHWATDKFKGPYVVTLTSMFGDELARYETSDSIQQVNLAEKSLKNEDNILVQVMAKADPSSQTDPAATLKRLSKPDRERIKNELDEIEGALSEKSALSKLYQARFYETNHLLADAAHAFLEAVKLSPEVPEYQKEYQYFLHRNSLKVTEK